MKYFFIIFYFLLFVLSILITYKKEKTLFSPFTIVAVNYCLFPLIATFQPLGLYELSIETHALILLSFFSFAICYYLFVLSKKKDLVLNNKPKNTINYYLLIIVNIGIFIFLVPRIVNAASIIRQHGWSYLRAFSEVTYSESTSENIIYIWFIKSFIIASIAVLSFDLFNNKNVMQIPAVVIVVLNVAADVIVFAARATLVKLIVYLALAMFFCKARKYSFKRISVIILFSFILLGSLVYVSNERMMESYSSFSFLDTIIMYYCAPYGLFNHYVNNPDFSMLSFDNMLFGGATFGFIYNIIRSGLYILFNAPYNGSEHIITQVTSIQIRVGSQVSMNAGSTATYIFMRDFGILGIILGFSFMASLIFLTKVLELVLFTLSSSILF